MVSTPRIRTSWGISSLRERTMRATVLLLAAAGAAAQVPGAASPYSPYNFGPNASDYTRDGMVKFTTAKLGLFIHWGPISQWGTEISFPLTCGAFPCTVAGPNRSAVVVHNTTQLRAHRQAYRVSVRRRPRARPGMWRAQRDEGALGAAMAHSARCNGDAAVWEAHRCGKRGRRCARLNVAADSAGA